MLPTRRISTSTAIALVGVTFLVLGVGRWLTDSSRTPVLALGFGTLFLLMGIAGVVDGRRRERQDRRDRRGPRPGG